MAKKHKSKKAKRVLKPRKRVATPKVKVVRVNKNEIVEVVAAKGAVPVVAAHDNKSVKVAATKEQTWMEYLFGTDKR
jgi:hypothetical protein